MSNELEQRAVMNGEPLTELEHLLNALDEDFCDADDSSASMNGKPLTELEHLLNALDNQSS